MLRPLAVLLATVLSLASIPAFAQAWPAKPVRFVVTFPPGGNVDVTARLFADALSKKWGQPVTVDNRPGGNEAVAAAVTKNFPADGYTFLFGSSAVVVNNPLLYKTLPYDPARDLVPVARISQVAFVLIVNPEVMPVHNVKELVALAKKQPGKLAFASDNPRGTSGAIGLMFSGVAGIDALHVPYKGSVEQIRETLAGRSHFTFNSLAPLVPFLQTGKLRALAVTSAERMTGLENVPTMNETYPGFNYAGWFLLYAATGTPDPIVQRVNNDIGALLKDPEIIAKLVSYGQMVEKSPGTPQSLAEFVRRDKEMWGAAFKAAKIEAE